MWVQRETVRSQHTGTAIQIGPVHQVVVCAIDLLHRWRSVRFRPQLTLSKIKGRSRLCPTSLGYFGDRVVMMMRDATNFVLGD